MKTLILLIATIAFINNAIAQKTSEILKQQAGQGVKEGASIATQSAANKVTDKVLNSIFNKKNKKKKAAKDDNTQETTVPAGNNNSNAQTNTETSNQTSANQQDDASLQTYSKYDFVPGDKVLVYEDFSQDAIGDFPLKWNTNSSGEVVTTSGQTGKWLMLTKSGVFLPESINSLPDNFTLEFDLLSFSNVPRLSTLFMSAGNSKNPDIPLNQDFMYNSRSGVTLGIEPALRDQTGTATIYTYTAGNKIIDNNVLFPDNVGTEIKVSVWRQKQRLRVYVGQNKVFDIPRAFATGETYNKVMFTTNWGSFYNQGKLLISNIKLAVGAPDTRNKLITEGKFSTTGILFDVNSANIKPESYGSLKDIADVLQDNANVHVKIIGHTDSDGDASTNLELSKKRAEAVKSFLQSEFKIDASRMETDGKGASDPVADNKTSEGKAQNRRVEFVKL